MTLRYSGPGWTTGRDEPRGHGLICTGPDDPRRNLRISEGAVSSALRSKAGPDLGTGLLHASHRNGVQPPAPLVPGNQMSASAGLLSRGNGRPAWDAVVELDADSVVDSGRHVIEADEHEEFEDFLRGPACGQLCPGRIRHAAVGVQLVG
jgi:hypothetical protein